MRKVLARVDRLQRLAVFESAGRLGSFSSAAQELGMTQPAVTRQIRALETSLGHDLFVRSSNRSRLSDAGIELHHAVSTGLDIVERGIEQIDHETEIFELATGPTMAQFVLMPMLDRLQEAVGSIDIRLTIFDGRSTFDRARYDAVTQLRPAPLPDMHSELLFPEAVVPVASPALADAAGLCLDSPPADLVRAPLIHEVQGFREWMSWDGWFEGHGVEPPDREQRVLLNNHPLVIQQAVAGEGVALGWRYLVDDLVKSGLLVHVGKETPTGQAFYLTWPADGSSGRCERLANLISEFVGVDGPARDVARTTV